MTNATTASLADVRAAAREAAAPGASMRGVCMPVMLALAERIPELVTVGTDGASAFESVASEFPERYIDVGIAEACCVGVAAGLARSGRKVFVTAIASFLVRRALDQIRIDAVEPGLDVTFVGHGGGLGYATLGSTHHLVEDVALFQAMPTRAIFVPADAEETAWALFAAAETGGPSYVRIPTRVGPDVAPPGRPIEIGHPRVLRSGGDVALLACGPPVASALTAAATLEEEGIQCTVASLSSIRPFHADALRAVVEGIDAVVVVDEHSRVGGLGLVVRDALEGTRCRRVYLGVDDRRPIIGEYEELLRFYGIDADAIAQAARSTLEDRLASAPVHKRRAHWTEGGIRR